MKFILSVATVFPTLALRASTSPVPATATAQGLDISNGLQSILANTDGSDGYTYPTDLTRGIVPRAIHSHNDYWRDVPFYTALSVGCISVEADVWLVNGTLYIGHERGALTSARTFDSLYIQPILDTLTRENPKTPFTSSSTTKNGVYDTNSGQTLYLFVDVKTDGPSSWPSVVKALQPLRDQGYLSTYNGTGVTMGAVTVIGTGNTPLSQVQPLQQRDYFYDANLAFLDSTQSNITAEVSPIASTQFSAYIGAINGTTFNETQLQTVQHHLAVAKQKGIKGRYWDTPAWPLSTRNAVWTTLTEQGVGLLNADDVVEAAGFGGVAGYW